MKKKVYIFGAGGTGRRVCSLIKDDYEILGYVDNDSTKWNTQINGMKCFTPNILCESEYDNIVLGTLMGYEELQKQIERMGIDTDKIVKGYVEFSVKARIEFLKRYSEEVYRIGIIGSVAEAGVFRGEFAKEINKYFPDRKCYLFDTFEGFVEKDIMCEKMESLVEANYMKGLSETTVLNKMPRKELVEIRKGYFPETTEGIDDTFCFVNLDMDLYSPTLSGLRFFYPRMREGGIILIHDYFSDAYPNLKEAVDTYEEEIGIQLARIPIGDDISLAIVKY